MKKVILMGIILSLLFIQSPTGITAETLISEEELDLYLQENLNVPNEVIDRYNYEQKLNVYQNEAMYISTKVSHGYINDNPSVELENAEDDNIIITPYALSNFAHYIDIFSTTPRTNNQVAFLVTYNWYYSESPYWLLTEKFGMAWTDDFRIRTGSVRAGYTYEAQNNKTGEWDIVSTSNNTFYNGIDGVGWEQKLVEPRLTSNGRFDPVTHYGWGQVIIERGKIASRAGDEVVSTVVGNLYHKVIGLSGDLSFSSTPQITISPSSGYLESGTSLETFDWTH